MFSDFSNTEFNVLAVFQTDEKCDQAEYFPFILELTTVFFYREKERTELKSKIEELEAFKSKYEEEKQQKEVSSNRCIMYINVKYFLITYIN